jgi:hypothetical protein
MHDPRLILFFAGLLGAIFGVVFADGKQLTDRFTLLLGLTPPFSFAACLYLIGLAPAETAFVSFFVGQGALVASLIGTEAFLSRR